MARAEDTPAAGGSRRDGRRPSGRGHRNPPDDRRRRSETPSRAPALPDGATIDELNPEVRRELRPLPKSLAETVGAHLVAVGMLLDDDPAAALAHARHARVKASRIAAVREANGLAAYHAGEWSETISELRAARRIGGGVGQLAILADCERALGRPERAVEIAASPEAKQLGKSDAVELRIVGAAARRDLGQLDGAIVALQGADLEHAPPEPWTARLRYAYADNLLAAGREHDALRWFVAAAEADFENETDAEERAEELAEQVSE